MTGKWFLRHRNPDLVEWMDQPDCDPVRLHNTYQNFRIVNRLLSGWRRVYVTRIRPCLAESSVTRMRLLDVGCGGGDIPRRIHQWALADGFDLEVTGIDPDSRALAFARHHHNPTKGLRFMQADSAELIRDGQTFDLVICNHVLHHLPAEGILPFLQELDQLSSRRVLCGDIARSAAGYALFSLFTLPFFRNSYIRPDGLISIRKSFTAKEIRAILPDSWTVEQPFPFRLLLIRDRVCDSTQPGMQSAKMRSDKVIQDKVNSAKNEI